MSISELPASTAAWVTRVGGPSADLKVGLTVRERWRDGKPSGRWPVGPRTLAHYRFVVRRNIAIGVQLKTLNASRALDSRVPHAILNTIGNHRLPVASRVSNHNPKDMHDSRSYYKDRGCTFPNCTAPGYASQVHHATLDWAHGGNTNIDDLDFSCGRHNRLVKKGGWHTRKNPDSTCEWIPPAHLPLKGGTNNHHHPDRLLRQLRKRGAG